MEEHMEHYNGEVDNKGNYGVSSDEKVLSSMAYISILFIVPFLARPDSQYCKFHANQGLVLFLLGNLITLALKFVPFGHGFLAWIWGLLSFALMIIGILNAAQGHAKELPLIGSIRILK
jgi:uncharacterized membrane protein